MNEDGTKVRMVVKSLINDLVIEVNEPGYSSQEVVIGKLNMLRYLVDTYMDTDVRVTDEDLKSIWEKEVGKSIIAITII